MFFLFPGVATILGSTTDAVESPGVLRNSFFETQRSLRERTQRMWRTLSELRVKLSGPCVSKNISKWIPNPVGLRQEKLSDPPCR